MTKRLIVDKYYDLEVKGLYVCVTKSFSEISFEYYEKKLDQSIKTGYYDCLDFCVIAVPVDADHMRLSVINRPLLAIAAMNLGIEKISCRFSSPHKYYSLVNVVKTSFRITDFTKT